MYILYLYILCRREFLGQMRFEESGNINSTDYLTRMVTSLSITSFWFDTVSGLGVALKEDRPCGMSQKTTWSLWDRDAELWPKTRKKLSWTEQQLCGNFLCGWNLLNCILRPEVNEAKWEQCWELSYIWALKLNACQVFQNLHYRLQHIIIRGTRK